MKNFNGDSLSDVIKHPRHPNYHAKQNQAFTNYLKSKKSFENLYQSKILIASYNLFMIVRLEDLCIDRINLSAMVYQEQILHNLETATDDLLLIAKSQPKKWYLQLNWIESYFNENDQFLSSQKDNLAIWLNPDLVIYIEKLAVCEDYDDIRQLIRENLLKPL